MGEQILIRKDGSVCKLGSLERTIANPGDRLLIRTPGEEEQENLE